jgi:SPP1 gp7 family putative phage head morphogenesis protein
MPVELGTVQPEAAIAHIRQKVGIPSKRWDQHMGAVQAKAFTVAGATKANLVNDFHQAVIAAKENGESIGQFRKRFDKVVSDHGWSYNGKRGWRTRVIYDTNMRTAAMAGRWQQIQRVKKTRPYMVYYTVGDDAVRDQHRQWHATALPVDDPWWNTHYPPNGWGCRCYVNTANAKQLKRWGIKVVDAPEIKTTQRINTRSGEDYGNVPVGIDTGWNYNVGKVWLGPDAALGQHLVNMPVALRDGIAASLPIKEADQAFKLWAKDKLAAKGGNGALQSMGWIDTDVLRALEAHNIKPLTAALAISDHRLRRMRRDFKTGRNKKNQDIALPEDVVLNLPQQLRGARAVLLDKGGSNDALIYVLDIEGTSKVAVAIDFIEQGELTNSVRSGGLTDLRKLKDKSKYTILIGDL